MSQVIKGRTSNSEYVYIQDPGTGLGKTGLAYNSGGAFATYTRAGAAAVSITLVTQTAAGGYSSGGFVEVDATKCPGLYRLDPPDAAYVTGVNTVTFNYGATGFQCNPKEVQLSAIDIQDAVRMGITALPNAAVNTAGGLAGIVQEAGTAQAGASGSITLRAGASATTDFYKSQLVKIVSGLGAGQRPVFITGYNGGTKVASVSPNFVTAPDNTSVYEVQDFGVDIATDATIAAAVWNELASGHTTVGTYGFILQPIRTGTAQAGAANSITLDAAASASNDFYKDALVRIISGSGAGQSRYVSGYTGASKVALVNGNWIVNPDNTSVFAVLNGAAIPGASAPSAATVAAAVWDELTSGHTINGSYGQAAQPIRANVAQGGAAGSITLDASASGSTDFYKDALVRIVAGLGAGQARWITAYNASTKVANVGRNWVINPDNTSVFLILNEAAGALNAQGMSDLLDADLGKPTAVVSGSWSLRKIIQYIGAKTLWPIRETATLQTLRNETDSGTISTCSQADDGTTYVKGADT